MSDPAANIIVASIIFLFIKASTVGFELIFLFILPVLGRKRIIQADAPAGKGLSRAELR
jgi:hypothetical protein